jgi:hypothetical protein
MTSSSAWLSLLMASAGVPFGSEEREPGHRLESLVARLVDGRHVRQLGAASQRGHAERAQLARLDVWYRRRQVAAEHLHLPGNHRLHRWRRALVGHVQQVDAGHHLEVLTRQVGRTAVAAGRERKFARFLLGQRDELGQVVGRDGRMDDAYIGRLVDQDHRLEVLDRIVGQLLVDRGVDAVRAGRADDEVVTVGRGILGL